MNRALRRAARRFLPELLATGLFIVTLATLAAAL